MLSKKTLKQLVTSADIFNVFLKGVSYIYYLLQFKKDQAKIQVLLDSDNKINAIFLAYLAQLGFKVKTTNVRV